MLEVGTTVAGFRIDGVLGREGMGVVYRATQLSLQREVALKLVSPELSNEPGFRERFRREGMTQAALDHPNVVPVYEAGESPIGLFIAMRLVRGTSLKQLILEDELDTQLALEILEGVARGLDAAHARGLIHRDIMPHDILVVGRQGYLGGTVGPAPCDVAAASRQRTADRCQSDRGVAVPSRPACAERSAPAANRSVGMASVGARAGARRRDPRLPDRAFPQQVATGDARAERRGDLGAGPSRLERSEERFFDRPPGRSARDRGRSSRR
jgi:Protein kinase domain